MTAPSPTVIYWPCLIAGRRVRPQSRASEAGDLYQVNSREYLTGSIKYCGHVCMTFCATARGGLISGYQRTRNTQLAAARRYRDGELVVVCCIFFCAASRCSKVLGIRPPQSRLAPPFLFLESKRHPCASAWFPTVRLLAVCFLAICIYARSCQKDIGSGPLTSPSPAGLLAQQSTSIGARAASP